MDALLAFPLSFGPALVCLGIVYWIDRYEREPWLLVAGMFAWGAVVAAVLSIILQVILQGTVHLATGSEAVAAVAGTTVFAPLTEETTKGAAVLLVFWLLRRELDSYLDGLVYAGTVALGFAATENLLYFLGAHAEGGTQGMLSLFVLRSVLGAWDHPVYTAFIGLGLAAARLAQQPLVRWGAPPLGWAGAVAAHALHNGLATGSGEIPALGCVMFFVDWVGWLAIAVVIVVSLRWEGKLLASYLADEVERGILSEAQYRTAASIRAQLTARLAALFGGRLGATRRFYLLLGELAHKKRQLARMGEEGGNRRIVEALRAEIAQLGPQAFA
jgi:RsiW-degrading membrane proteinase PrsW (M82 family)